MSNKSIEYLRKAYKGSISKEIFDKLEFLYKLIINNDLAGLSEAHRVNFEKIFPQEIAVLYKTVPDISLKFVSTLILELLKPKFLNRFKENSSNSNSSQSLFGTWEHLLRIFVNSLEAYSESCPKGHVQLGKMFYKPLFGLLSSPAGSKLSTRSKIQLYGFLSDLAESSSANKELLRQKNVLGGSRLGSIISSTNEYLILVILLQLLASMISDNPDEDAVENIGKEVFQSLKAKKAFGKQGSIELVKTLQSAGDAAWDSIADLLIRTMAAFDAEKPKPFLLASSEIKANNQIFVHPKTLRHMYMDNAAFIVNIEDEDDIDCLEIAFQSITSIHFKETSAPDTNIEITLYLSSPPMRATGTVPSKTNSHTVIFEINRAHLHEFEDALKYRGLEILIERVGSCSSRTKQSVAGQPLDLNNISVIPLEVKSIEVEQFYRSSTPEAIVSPKGSISEAIAETEMIAFTTNTKLASSTDEEASGPIFNATLQTISPMRPNVKNSNDTHTSLLRLGSCKKPEELKVSQQTVPSDTPKSLKRKRKTEDVNKNNGPEKEHYYNSQYLTTTVPFSTKKYKARSRKLDSPYFPSTSGSESEDVIILRSPVCGPKPLRKLNVDRPERLILSTDSRKMDKKTRTNSVPPSPVPASMNKPRPKPKPKKRKVVVDSDSDDAVHLSPMKSVNEEITMTESVLALPQNNSPVQTIFPQSPPPFQVPVTSDGGRKSTVAAPIPIAASSPFNDKFSKSRGFTKNETTSEVDENQPAINLPKLGPVMETDSSDKPDNSYYEIVPDRSTMLLQEPVVKGLVGSGERSETKDLNSRAVNARPLKSALKHALQPKPSVIDLTHLGDVENEIVEMTVQKPAPIRVSKYYASKNVGSEKKERAEIRQVDTSSKAKRSTVSFEDEREDHSSKININGRSFVTKEKAPSKESYSLIFPPTPPSKVLKKSSYTKNAKVFIESSQSDSSEDEISSDQKVINILNKIQETIVGNLGHKFRRSTAARNAITDQLRLYAAEELENMLRESIEHYANMVKIEQEYADYGRSLMGGLEEIEQATQEIYQTLQQTIQDHDTLSLVRKMPTKLAPRPKLV